MKKILKYLVLFIILLCLAAFALLQTPAAKHYAVNYIAGIVFKNTGLGIKIGEVDLLLPNRIKVRHVVLDEDNKPLMNIDDLYVKISLNEVLNGKYVVDKIRIKGIQLIHLPPSSNSTAFDINKLIGKVPYFDIRDLEIADLSISPEISNALPSLINNCISKCRTQKIRASILHDPLIGTLKADVLMGNEDSQENEMHAALQATYIESRIESKFELIHTSLGLSLNGMLAVSPEFHIDGSSFEAHMDDIAFLENWLKIPANGQMNVSLTAAGNFQTPKIMLNAQSPGLNFAGQNIENLILDAAIQPSQQQIDGAFKVSAVTMNFAVSSASDFHQDAGGVNLSNLRLFLPHVQIRGGLNLNSGLELSEGNFEGDCDDLSSFAKIIDHQIGGSCHFTGSIKGEQGSAANAAVSVHIPRAVYDGIYAENALISAQIQDLSSEFKAKLSLSANQISHNEITFKEFIASTEISSSLSLWPYHLSSKGKWDKNFELETKGVWKLSPQSLLVTMDTFNGIADVTPITLNDPIHISVESDRISLSPIALAIGKGLLNASIDYHETAMQCTIGMRDIPLDVIQLAKSHFPIRGFFSAQALLYGNPNRLTGQIQASVSEAKVLEESFAKIPPLKSSIEANLLENRLVASGKINGFEKNPIEFHAEVPMSLGLFPFNFKIDQAAPFSANFRAIGEIYPLLQLFGTDSAIIAGKTSIDINASGTLAAPHINGKGILTEGFYESLFSGAVFKNIHAELEAIDSKISIKDFSAEAENGGKVSATGALEVASNKQYPYQLSIKLDNAAVLKLDLARANASGNLMLEGNAGQATLKGKITANALQVTLPEQTPALSHTVEISYINQPPHEKPPTKAIKQSIKWPLNLDVEISVPGTASIKSKDLTSEWKGKILVTGTSMAPLCNGEISIIKGEYMFNGSPFDISQGTITFSGDPEKKTTLYVIASKDLDKIKADVILKGPIKNPSIAFRSNPPLSQQEILSYLLFNRGITDITPFEGAQLTQSVTKLKPSNDGPDVLTKLRNNIGIDRIDINRGDTPDSNEVSLQVGKYISRGILVSINKSITAEANRLAIEANVIHNIKLQAEIGDDSEGQLLLKWKHDY